VTAMLVVISRILVWRHWVQAMDLVVVERWLHWVDLNC